MRVLLENTTFLLHKIVRIAGIIRVAGIIRGRALYEEYDEKWKKIIQLVKSQDLMPFRSIVPSPSTAL